MSYTLEVIPGKSIGPFRLGMTAQDVESALRAFAPERTLWDLGIVVHFAETGEPGVEARCSRISVCVVGNSGDVVLFGRRVNEIDRDEAASLLASSGFPLRRSYSYCEIEKIGIQAFRWESSDDWIYAFDVVPPSVDDPRKSDGEASGDVAL